MRKLSTALLIFFGLASAALAQTVQNPTPNAGGYGAYNSAPPTCVSGSGCWFQTDVNGNLKVSGTFSGSVATGATATATLPTLTAGSRAIYESLSGGQFSQLILGTDIVDLTHGLPVQPMTASTWAVTGTVTANLGTIGAAATAALQTTGNTALTTINTTLGTPFQSGGSIGNTTFAVTNAGTFAVQAQPTPVTTGGLSVYFVQPTASDNHVVIKAGAGQVYKISITNNSATVNYIRLYNATTGFNGCNSSTNLIYGNAIPGNTTATGIMDQWEMGMAFSTGISICVTSGYATNDTTAATASAMNVNIGYK